MPANYVFNDYQDNCGCFGCIGVVIICAALSKDIFVKIPKFGYNTLHNAALVSSLSDITRLLYMI